MLRWDLAVELPAYMCTCGASVTQHSLRPEISTIEILNADNCYTTDIYGVFDIVGLGVGWGNTFDLYLAC